MTITSRGKPVSTSRPRMGISRGSLKSTAAPIFFFISSATISPKTKLNSSRAKRIMSRSKDRPATFETFQLTMPSKEITATSVKSPPKSTTIFPVGSWMGTRAPMAAAMIFSTKKTWPAPADSTTSSTAFFSTSVTSSGMPTTTLGLPPKENLSACTRSIKYFSIFSATSKSEITPCSKGMAAKICGGVFPSIFLASSPTAKIWSVRLLIATTDDSLITIPRSCWKIKVLVVPKSMPRFFLNLLANRLNINHLGKI